MPTTLADGIWWIDLGTVNAYLVADGDLTLVDCGMPWNTAAITDAVAAAGHGLGDVDRVLITHYDLDHVGALSNLALPADVTVYVGAADAPHVTGAEKPPLADRKGLLQRIVGRFAGTVEDVTPVEDGDTIGPFTAHHTPGHTPGHTAFVSEAHSAAFLGDLVREADGRLAASPWYISQDTDAVRESINRLAAADLGFEVAAMGHGTPFSEGGSDRLAALAARL